MARFTFNIWETEAPYAPGGEADYAAVMEAHGAFSRAVVEAGGRVVAGEALQGLSTASFLAGTRTDEVRMIDNPLPELKQVLGGFYVVEVPDRDTALALAELCPAPYGFIEVRPVWEFDDQGVPATGYDGSPHS